MSGRRGGYNQEQPQGQQPPWDSAPPPNHPQSGPPTGYPPPGPPPGFRTPGFPPPGYSPRGRRGAPPSGYGGPQLPPRRRARRKRSRKLNAFLLVFAAIFLIGVIASALGNGNGSSPKSAASSGATVKTSSSAGTQASAASKAIAAKEDACHKRTPASGNIYIRIVTPGVSPQARRLGGEWEWDHITDKCLTSVQFTIAAAPLTSGNCTQIGYVADNPGYDVNANVAPPLTRVVAQAGPACQTTTASTPVQTTPATAPPTQPASTAPAPIPYFCKFHVVWQVTGDSLDIVEALDATLGSCQDQAATLTSDSQRTSLGTFGIFIATFVARLTSTPSGWCSLDGVTLTDASQGQFIGCGWLQATIDSLVTP